MKLDYQLILAIWDGDLEVIKSFVSNSNGANVHTWDNGALRWAAENGHLETEDYLITEGANFHTVYDFVFRIAVCDGHLEMVKYLVENHDTDVHAWGEGALRNAAWKGHLDIVKYLVEDCEADVHAMGDFALRIAVYYEHLDVVKYLKFYKLSQFTKKHIDKQNLRYVFQQYELPFEIKQLISSYVLKKGRTDHSLII